MKLLREMDLYKAIVLVSVVALPLLGWWVHDLDQQIVASRKAIDEATRAGGLLEQIGSLQRKVEVVVQNRLSTSESIKEPRAYFEGQILASAQGSGGLKANDFSPNPPREELFTLPSRQRIADYVVDIGWPRKDLVVPMDFVYAVLFNCESGASRMQTQVQQSVWKLRELRLDNATDERIARDIQGFKTPPPELADKWSIKQMSFARREPRKGS